MVIGDNVWREGERRVVDVVKDGGEVRRLQKITRAILLDVHVGCIVTGVAARRLVKPAPGHVNEALYVDPIAPPQALHSRPECPVEFLHTGIGNAVGLGIIVNVKA